MINISNIYIIHTFLITEKGEGGIFYLCLILPTKNYILSFPEDSEKSEICNGSLQIKISWSLNIARIRKELFVEDNFA